MSVIGIDFGTEFSSVAARLQDGHIHTLADDQGKVRISSCISFLEDEIRIGNLAELKRETNVKNTLYDFKMILGQDLKTAMQLKKKFEWPFVLVKDDNGNTQFQVQYLKTTHHFYPEEIVAILFHHLVQIAEKRMQPIRVSGAVITVPSTFNHLQRKSIMDAARIANIEVECLLNETTASALCYSSFSAICKKNISQCAMVIHIGSGTLTVALCRIKGLTVSVEAIDGASLGGKDINLSIFGYMKTLRMKENSTLISYSNLHNMIERVKKDFCVSEKRRSKLMIQSKNGKGEEYVDIQRDVFQKACCPIRESLESAINGVMDYAAKTPDEIDKVLVVGGSTRLSLVHDILDKLKLKPKLEMTGVKTDEAAVLGACVQACKQFLSSKPELFDRYGRLMISAKCKNFVKFLLTLKIDENGMLSIFGKELTDVIDGLPEDKISELVAQQSQLREGHAEKKLAEDAWYDLEKDVFNTMKMARKLLKDCEALEKWIENNSDSTLTAVRVKKEELKSLLRPFSRNDNVEQLYQHLEQLQGENTHWKTQISKLQDYIKTLEREKQRLECMHDKPTTSSKKGFSRDSSQNLEILLQENKCLKEKESNQSRAIKAKEHEIKKLQRMLELGGKSFADEEAKLKEQISKKDKDIEALHKELSCKAKLTTQEEYEKLKHARRTFKQQLSEKDKKIEDLQKILECKTIVKSNEEYEKLKCDFEIVVQQNKEATEEIDNLKTQMQRKNEEYKSNEFSLKRRIEEKRTEIWKLMHAETTFKQQLSEKDKEIEDLQKLFECKTNVKTNDEYAKLECDMEIVVQRNKEATEEIDNLKTQMLGINSKYRSNEISLKRRIEKKRTEIWKLEHAESTFKQQLSEKDKKIEDLQKLLECKTNLKTNEEYEKLKCDMEIVLQRNKEATEEIDNLKTQMQEINDEENATLKRFQELTLSEKKDIENDKKAMSKLLQEAKFKLSENEKEINKLNNEVKGLRVNKDKLFAENMELHEEREKLQAQLEHYGESAHYLAIQRNDTGSRRIHVGRNPDTQECVVINELKNSRSPDGTSKSSSRKKRASDADRYPKPGSAKRCSPNELEDSKSRPSSSQSDPKKKGKGFRLPRLPWK